MPTVAHPESVTVTVPASIMTTATRSTIPLVFDRRTSPLSLCDLGALAEKKERTAHLEPIAAFERIAARHRLSIHKNLAAGRTDHKILALAPDNRMTAEHALIAEQADIAFLGARDNRHALGQRIFAALARVAALTAHNHQPSALEQLADQSDKKSDQRAEDNDRDRAPERLRKLERQTLIDEPAYRSAQQTPNY